MIHDGEGERIEGSKKGMEVIIDKRIEKKRKEKK